MILMHSFDMKNLTFGLAFKRASLGLKLRQNKESAAKKFTKTDEQMPYIPRLSRSVDPAKVSNCFKGSKILEKVVEEGSNKNKARKRNLF